MLTLNRYRMYCTDHTAVERYWAEVLPVDGGGHTFDTVQTTIETSKIATPVAVDPMMEPVEPGASRVVANGRPATEIQNGVTGYATIQEVWSAEQSATAKLRVTIKFILKAAGTGTKVRLAIKVKSQGVGEDSSVAFGVVDFVVVTVTHTTVGEVFEGYVEVGVSGCNLDDALALQVGRDGNNDLGAGDNDDVDVAIQIIGMRAEAYDAG